MNNQKDSIIYLVDAVVEEKYVEKREKSGRGGIFRVLKAVDKFAGFSAFSTG